MEPVYYTLVHIEHHVDMFRFPRVVIAFIQVKTAGPKYPYDYISWE